MYCDVSICFLFCDSIILLAIPISTAASTECGAFYSTHPPIPPTNVGQCYEYFISCKYKGERGELSVPGPLRHSHVRRATVHAHTIPNLKPEIWTKHCVTPSSISYVSYFISLSSLSLSLLEPDQSSRIRCRRTGPRFGH